MDSLIIELHSNTSPFTTVITVTVLLHSDGSMSNTISGSFYVIIKRRKSITTWRAMPVILSTSQSGLYDFTFNATQAYRSNMIEVEPGKWALFIGDLNEDENIDLLDASLVENDMNDF